MRIIFLVLLTTAVCGSMCLSSPTFGRQKFWLNVLVWYHVCKMTPVAGEVEKYEINVAEATTLCPILIRQGTIAFFFAKKLVTDSH